MLAVTLVLDLGLQPRDALLATPLPQQLFLSIFVDVNVKLACARPIHVVEKANTVPSPGSSHGAGQQPGVLAGQHRRRLQVEVVSYGAHSVGQGLTMTERINFHKRRGDSPGPVVWSPLGPVYEVGVGPLLLSQSAASLFLS